VRDDEQEMYVSAMGLCALNIKACSSDRFSWKKIEANHDHRDRFLV